jgi:hypothetical protein
LTGGEGRKGGRKGVRDEMRSGESEDWLSALLLEMFSEDVLAFVEVFILRELD